MLNRTNVLIALIAIAGAVGGFVAGGWLRSPVDAPVLTRPAIGPGDPAPALSLPDPARKVHSLAEWRGKYVLVNFWATWCGPCREEMPLLNAAQSDYAARNLQVVGIAVDDPESVGRFLAARPVSYPILIDDPGASVDAPQRFGDNRDVLPYSVLVDPQGHLLARRFGSFNHETLGAWLDPHLPRSGENSVELRRSGQIAPPPAD